MATVAVVQPKRTFDLDERADGVDSAPSGRGTIVDRGLGLWTGSLAVGAGVVLKVVAGLTDCALGMTPMDLICWDAGFIVESLRWSGSISGEVVPSCEDQCG